MKENRQIQQEARAAFLSQYWISIAMVLVYVLLFGGISFIGGFENTSHHAGSLSYAYQHTYSNSTASSLISLFFLILSGPITVGINWFFLLVWRRERATLSAPFQKGFGVNIGRKIGGYLWMELFTCLWTLLFVVPGVIKSFSYAMTPYILADQPEVSATEALKKSMQMMRGEKWKLFCLYLRFFGWIILGLFTFGLLWIFYVGPWMRTSLAGFYEELKLSLEPQQITHGTVPPGTGNSSKDNWICPRCGHSNQVDGRFCEQCGIKRPDSTQPPAGWTCKQCGSYNPDGTFCANCGAKNSEETNTEQQKPTDSAEPARMRCPTCGYLMREDQVGITCPICGTKIK